MNQIIKCFFGFHKWLVKENVSTCAHTGVKFYRNFKRCLACEKWKEPKRHHRYELPEKQVKK